MHFNKTGKRLSALTMLSLMTFIFVVKVFHASAHDTCVNFSVNGNGVNHICTICEYHFTKDADNFHSVISIPDAVNFLFSDTCKISAYFFAAVNIITLRGPPFTTGILQ